VAKGERRGDRSKTSAKARDAKECLTEQPHYGLQCSASGSALARREQLRRVAARAAHMSMTIAFWSPGQWVTTITCKPRASSRQTRQVLSLPHQALAKAKHVWAYSSHRPLGSADLHARPPPTDHGTKTRTWASAHKRDAWTALLSWKYVQSCPLWSPS
jgi:hypothetical protein